MKKIITSLSLFFVLFSMASSAHAQVTTLDHLFPGYQPTVLASSTEVSAIFDGMPNTFKMGTFLGGASQCFMRAEIWSYDLYRNHHINTMKVFLYFTHAFKDAYKDMFHKKFVWWFHVTPYVLVQNADGSGVQELTLDKTFIEAPESVQQWETHFIPTHKKCAEFVPFEQFKNEVLDGPNAITGTEHCYLVRVPGTDFDEHDAEMRDAGMLKDYQFNMDDVRVSADQAPTIWTRGKIKELLGLKD